MEANGTTGSPQAWFTYHCHHKPGLHVIFTYGWKQIFHKNVYTSMML
jgi:hypothetical protein